MFEAVDVLIIRQQAYKLRAFVWSLKRAGHFWPTVPGREAYWEHKLLGYELNVYTELVVLAVNRCV